MRDCLAEELRRLDPDEIYTDALMAVPKVTKGRVAAPASSKPAAKAAAKAPAKAAKAPAATDEAPEAKPKRSSSKKATAKAES